MPYCIFSTRIKNKIKKQILWVVLNPLIPVFFDSYESKKKKKTLTWPSNNLLVLPLNNMICFKCESRLKTLHVGYIKETIKSGSVFCFLAWLESTLKHKKSRLTTWLSVKVENHQVECVTKHHCSNERYFDIKRDKKFWNWTLGA